MPPAQDPRPLRERVLAYGCTNLVNLRAEGVGPDQLEYLDLVVRRGAATLPVPVSAVAEHQGTALLYLVDGATKINATDRGAIQNILANRSDPAWLGIVQPGSLEIFPIGFGASGDEPLKIVGADQPEAPLFFQSLVQGTFAEEHPPNGMDYVYQHIFEMLENTIHAFVPDLMPKKKGTRREGAVDISPTLAPLEVLSLAGRALFFRFLVDRKIVLPDELSEICPAADDLKDAFSSAKKAALTSAWLDETFNGDFLRLIDEKIPPYEREARTRSYQRFYSNIDRKTNGRIFRHLWAILRGWKSVFSDGFQGVLDWDELNFAHIPVGVLSQVYESFSHRADPRTARETSVHYTPRSIARLVVDETFAAVENPSVARVLDPACGAGIFLALAFQRLVRARWLADKERPSAKRIRQILYCQLRGFDISESALRLAALTLYITAIELNGSPRPPKTLRFPRNLRNKVLFHFGDDPVAEQEDETGFPLGSLGPRVPTYFNKYFDVVLGNPPWTRLREEEVQQGKDASKKKRSASRSKTDKLNDEFTAIGQRVLRARGFDTLAKHYKNPDKNPDLPFLWRATEWGKDGAIIALVLHARIFRRATGEDEDSWQMLLNAISITGLIDCTDLRKTAIWRKVDVPYCLLFARNAVAPREQRFHFAVPRYEPMINGQGRFRIDYETTKPIGIKQIERRPWLLKSLMFGTWADVEIIERLKVAFPQTLIRAWEMWDPKGERTGEGYNRSANLKQAPHVFLADYKDFEKPTVGYSIRYDELLTYEQKHGAKTANMPRRKELYEAPLVIVPKSPGEDPRAPKAYRAMQSLVFSKIYYGFSCAGHPDGATLAALLYLVPHTELFLYFCLMTSRSFGFDRLVFIKSDLDAFPFPDVAALKSPMKKKIQSLAHQLEHDSHKPWDAINSTIYDLYGLDEDAIATMQDTLHSAAHFREKAREIFQPPRRDTERATVRNELRSMLEPFFDVCGQHVVVEEPNFQQDEWRQAWCFLAIGRSGEEVPVSHELLVKAMAEADKRGASRIIVRTPAQQGLLLGLLNQRRYWTRTRARLCAQHILRYCMDAFGLEGDA